MSPSDLIIVVTPAAVGVGFLGLLVLVSVSFLAGVWAMRPHRRDQPPSVECADTVELPRGRGAGGPRTHILLSGAHLRRDADDTIVIDSTGLGR